MARDTWFETVAIAQERAKKRLPKSAYSSLISASEKGLTVADNVADADGMMVSLIQSNYYGFGSGVVVDGISLQNRAYGFTLDPAHPNCVAGGKRPFHTIIPGFILMALFSGYIGWWSLRHPDQVPPPDAPTTFVEKLRLSGNLIPCALLIVFIVWVLVAGWATATECAAFGVLGSLAIAAWGRSLTWQAFKDGLMGATRTSCMIMFILAGAAFLLWHLHWMTVIGDDAWLMLGLAFALFKTIDYSTFRAAKEILYIPLSFDARYRAKEVIDVFGYRFGKLSLAIAPADKPRKPSAAVSLADFIGKR